MATFSAINSLLEYEYEDEDEGGDKNSRDKDYVVNKGLVGDKNSGGKVFVASDEAMKGLCLSRVKQNGRERLIFEDKEKELFLLLKYTQEFDSSAVKILGMKIFNTLKSIYNSSKKASNEVIELLKRDIDDLINMIDSLNGENGNPSQITERIKYRMEKAGVFKDSLKEDVIEMLQVGFYVDRDFSRILYSPVKDLNRKESERKGIVNSDKDVIHVDVNGVINIFNTISFSIKNPQILLENLASYVKGMPSFYEVRKRICPKIDVLISMFKNFPYKDLNVKSPSEILSKIKDNLFEKTKDQNGKAASSNVECNMLEEVQMIVSKYNPIDVCDRLKVMIRNAMNGKIVDITSIQKELSMFEFFLEAYPNSGDNINLCEEAKKVFKIFELLEVFENVSSDVDFTGFTVDYIRRDLKNLFRFLESQGDLFFDPNVILAHMKERLMKEMSSDASKYDRVNFYSSPYSRRKNGAEALFSDSILNDVDNLISLLNNYPQNDQTKECLDILNGIKKRILIERKTNGHKTHCGWLARNIERLMDIIYDPYLILENIKSSALESKSFNFRVGHLDDLTLITESYLPSSFKAPFIKVLNDLKRRLYVSYNGGFDKTIKAKKRAKLRKGSAKNDFDVMSDNFIYRKKEFVWIEDASDDFMRDDDAIVRESVIEWEQEHPGVDGDHIYERYKYEADDEEDGPADYTDMYPKGYFDHDDDYETRVEREWDKYVAEKYSDLNYGVSEEDGDYNPSDDLYRY
ncbi:MAG: hypothetical protein WC806_02750 [Candidatus Gracilibacteria bacterium]|jgi:hypothetical protein